MKRNNSARAIQKDFFARPATHMLSIKFGYRRPAFSARRLAISFCSGVSLVLGRPLGDGFFQGGVFTALGERLLFESGHAAIEIMKVPGEGVDVLREGIVGVIDLRIEIGIHLDDPLFDLAHLDA